ncbi:MAG TPA: hypothetical protein VGM05_00505 [Planctomycetaceae bacterium]|jgi:hypothetical protein
MKFASVSTCLVGLLFGILIAGCGGEVPESAKSKPAGKPRPAAQEREPDSSPDEVAPKKTKFQPVTLGSDSAGDNATSSTNKAPLSGEKRSQAIIVALQPMQVLLGQWRWITNKKFEGSNKSGEDLEWIWDFKHDRAQPSLTAKCDSHPYFQQVWLSYLPEEDKFRATVKPTDGDSREFRGTWTDGGEPKEESDGKKAQHTYKLQLTQVTPADGDQWQLVFSQLDNNQYLMTMTRRPAAGKQYGPLDVVRQQRLGTSFAVADSDNPGPKCIISGGLGTMNVTYKGKSYPVCCSGCAAAFNDDPERWLAKLAEREKNKKRDDD